MKKVILSLAAVLTMFASVPAFAASVADSEVSTANTEQSKTFVYDLSFYTSGGEKRVGVIHFSVNVTTQRVNDGIRATVTENKNYELEPQFASIPAYRDTYRDSSKTNTYNITDDEYTKSQFPKGINGMFQFLLQNRMDLTIPKV